MKHLLLLLTALIFSSAAFATFGSINGTTSICAGTSTTLTNSTPGGSWSSSNTAVATVGGTTGTVQGITAGTTLISYTLGGSSASTVVTVNPAPPPVTGPDIVCAASTLSLTDGTTGGTWSSGNTAIATAGSISGIITGMSAGTVLVSYTIGNGCTTSYEITVEPLPSVITGTTSICSGSSAPLSDTAVGGTWSSSNTAHATINTIGGELSGIAPGTSVITYTSNMGCIATTIATVHPAAPSVSLSAMPGFTLCQGVDTFSATITGTTAILSEEWFLFDVPVSALDTLVLVPGSGDSLSFTLRAVSACTGDTVTINTDTMRITVNPFPALTLSGRDSICAGASDTLVAHTMYSPILFWSPPAGLSCTSCDTVHTTFTSGAQVYTVIATTSAGCADTASFKVTVNPLPITTVSPDPIFVCRDSTIQLIAGGAATYSWLPTTGLSCSTCDTTTLTGTVNIVYYLRGTTALGCADSTTVPVSVDTTCSLSVPVISGGGGLSIYPNPAHDLLTIQMDNSPISRIAITDLLGRVLYQQNTLPAQQLQVDISSMAGGIYFIRVNNTLVRKFVKE